MNNVRAHANTLIAHPKRLHVHGKDIPTCIYKSLRDVNNHIPGHLRRYLLSDRILKFARLLRAKDEAPGKRLIYML